MNSEWLHRHMTVLLCVHIKNHMRDCALKMDRVWFSWKNENMTVGQSEKLCSSVSLIHATFQTGGCSIRLFCCEACSGTAWFMKYSHVHRSCCSPADKSQVLLMLHFLCCHSGLFWWLLLWVGWVGEKATGRKMEWEYTPRENEESESESESLCNGHHQQELTVKSKPAV